MDYNYVFLSLYLSVRLYKQYLDYPNIIYSIVKVKKLRYKELDIFVL